ncbi:MAG: hypothetical protein HQL52_18690 [Magnetococcales bacterium]|nr:hypothetical protein [Magnetococcales bacterium]
MAKISSPDTPEGVVEIFAPAAIPPFADQGMGINPLKVPHLKENNILTCLNHPLTPATCLDDPLSWPQLFNLNPAVGRVWLVQNIGSHSELGEIAVTLLVTRLSPDLLGGLRGWGMYVRLTAGFRFKRLRT